MAQKTIRQLILEDEYAHLNPMQQQAVFSTGHPLLILAGAGSGKTTVIVNKIGYMLRYGTTYNCLDTISKEDEAFLQNCLTDKTLRTGERYDSLMRIGALPAYNVLAITFTNKAAGEMRDRIEKQFSISAQDLWALTFHALCVRILRRHINLLGFDNGFTIYDDADSNKLMDTCIKQLGCGEQYPVRLVRRIISNAKTSYQTPEQFEARYKDTGLPKVPKLYKLYQENLKQSNALDFDDLIFYTVKILEEYPDVQQQVNHRFRYVLVDEYQDTNPLQYKLVSMLAAHGNICVVGDDDQSIYRFMGASIDNILSFENSFGNAQVIRLEQNYRSTKTILDAANSVIAHNTMRKGKTLWTALETGAKITYNRLQTHNEEAAYIAKTILTDITEKGMHYNDFCVLYRTHSQSNAIELAMKGNGIPYKVYGGLAFLKRKEIQDVLAYLNVCCNPNDRTRLFRIINQPKRGIGDSTLDKTVQIAQQTGQNIFTIIEQAADYPELSRAKDKLILFAQMIRDLRVKMAQMKLSDFYLYALQQTGYMAMINDLDPLERATRKDNLQEFYNTIITFEQQVQSATLQGFLEEMALVSAVDNMDENDACVTLMTMHCAKGLEFDTVFVSGFDEGIFPSSQSVGEPGGLEEERRLCYVAITRAKRRLVVLSANARMMYGMTRPCYPSRFLKEIPQTLIQQVEHPRAVRPQPKQPVRHILNDPVTAIPKEKVQDIYKSGMRVRHKAFGDGTVTTVTAMTSDTLLEVQFDTSGKKKLMANFAKLQIL